MVLLIVQTLDYEVTQHLVDHFLNQSVKNRSCQNVKTEQFPNERDEFNRTYLTSINKYTLQ